MEKLAIKRLGIGSLEVARSHMNAAALCYWQMVVDRAVGQWWSQRTLLPKPGQLAAQMGWLPLSGELAQTRANHPGT